MCAYSSDSRHCASAWARRTRPTSKPHKSTHRPAVLHNKSVPIYRRERSEEVEVYSRQQTSRCISTSNESWVLIFIFIRRLTEVSSIGYCCQDRGIHWGPIGPTENPNLVTRIMRLPKRNSKLNLFFVSLNTVWRLSLSFIEKWILKVKEQTIVEYQNHLYCRIYKVSRNGSAKF